MGIVKENSRDQLVIFELDRWESYLRILFFFFSKIFAIVTDDFCRENRKYKVDEVSGKIRKTRAFVKRKVLPFLGFRLKAAGRTFRQWGGIR